MTLLALVALTLCVGYPLGRLGFYSVGAILSLGPADLTSSKLYYFVGLIFLSLNSLMRLYQLTGSSRSWLNKMKVLIFLLALLLFLNFSVSILNGYSILEIVRNQTAILIFLLGIPIAVWCGLNIEIATILDGAVVLGFFSAISFWYVWSQQHGLLRLASGQFALASEWTAFLGLAVSLTTKSLGRIRNFLYTSSAVLVLLLFIASLTRTNILLATWIIVMSILIKSGRILNFLKLTTLGFAALGVIIFGLPGLLSNSAFTQRIFGSWNRFSIGGLSDSGLGSDSSLIMRKIQAKLAMSLFSGDPIFGVGQLPRGQTFDTIIACLAQYGILGILLLVCIYLKLYRILGTKSAQSCLYIFPFFSALLPACFIYNWVGGRSIWIASGVALAISVSQQESLTTNSNNSVT